MSLTISDSGVHVVRKYTICILIPGINTETIITFPNTVVVVYTSSLSRTYVLTTYVRTSLTISDSGVHVVRKYTICILIPGINTETIITFPNTVVVVYTSSLSRTYVLTTYVRTSLTISDSGVHVVRKHTICVLIPGINTETIITFLNTVVVVCTSSLSRTYVLTTPSIITTVTVYTHLFYTWYIKIQQ